MTSLTRGRKLSSVGAHCSRALPEVLTRAACCLLLPVTATEAGAMCPRFPDAGTGHTAVEWVPEDTPWSVQRQTLDQTLRSVQRLELQKVARPCLVSMPLGHSLQSS